MQPEYERIRGVQNNERNVGGDKASRVIGNEYSERFPADERDEFVPVLESKVLGSVHTLPFLASARFARAVAVDDAALRQIVRREFDVHAIARKNLDVMAAQPAGDVRENDVAVVEFDRKGGARKDLLDAAVDL